MAEHLDTAFIFGNLGNLTEALDGGWSVEDNVAWAVDSESRLNLPLPGDASRYVLRLNVKPLEAPPGLRDVQRLSIDTEAGPLASFSIDRQTTIELALPIELTRGNRRIALVLRHPDALRPSDFRPSADTRLLSVCFLSGSLARQDTDTSEAATAPLCHLIVAGSGLARQLAAVIRALPTLRRRVACHLVDTDLGPGAHMPPAEAVESAALCWEQTGGKGDAGWSGLRRRLPAGCDLRRFGSPRMNALWPFLGSDDRQVPEPGLYPDGRYPFGDRVGAALAHLPLTDDVMQLSYDSVTEKEMPDLDALLADDRGAWRRMDAMHDVKIADFIVENFRRYRLFFAPPYPSGELLRYMILQLVTGSPIEALCSPAALRRDLDFLLTGYIGARQQLPIQPQVARWFGLAWWQPGMRYRWDGNHWTFEEYALRYIRWTPWRP